jgi:hypothetical protein
MIYAIDPVQDPRWTELVDRHPRSSAFHTRAWLEALHRTYGYQPVAYTTSPPGVPLEDGVVFCDVNSWITGRRLISLPFSDHCEPLWNSAAGARVFLRALEQRLRAQEFRYVEIRPVQPLTATMDLYRSSQDYGFHVIDLRPDLATLFANCHKSSTQRKITRAKKERLDYESGRSEELLDIFWDLLLITRRRHRIPPQPKAWFHNLVRCFGDRLVIRVVRHGKMPVSSILTIQHNRTMVYKYGCSDARLSNLGGTQLLFWKAIQEAKAEGLQTFDLGRTDCNNAGLLRFKDGWGSTRSTLTYSRFSASPRSDAPRPASAEQLMRIARRMVPYLPTIVLRMAGSALYRHIA